MKGLKENAFLFLCQFNDEKERANWAPLPFPLFSSLEHYTCLNIIYKELQLSHGCTTALNDDKLYLLIRLTRIIAFE